MLSELEKRKLINFIVTMQKTGKNIHDSLLHYSEKVTKDDNAKTVLSEVVSKLSKGSKLEDSLYSAGVLDDFQYSILNATADKKKAFEKILNFTNKKNSADKFYKSIWLKSTAIWVGVFLVLPLLNSYFIDTLETLAKQKKDFQIYWYVEFIMANNDYYIFCAIFIFIIALYIAYFYKDSYENDVETHYKLFRYKALMQNRQLIDLLADLMNSGSTFNKALNILSEYIEPKDLRNHLLKIKEAFVKRNEEAFEEAFKRIYIDDNTLFILSSSLETKTIKRSVNNAKISCETYEKEFGDDYKENFDLIAFTVNALPITGVGLYFILLEITIAMA